MSYVVKYPGRLFLLFINAYCVLLYLYVILVNECLVKNGGCGHICEDTLDSCRCNEGYRLDEDERIALVRNLLTNTSRTNYYFIDVDECW